MQKTSEKIIKLVLCVIVWATGISIISESIPSTIENTTVKALCYLAFAIYISLPFDMIIAYILRAKKKVI